MKQNVPTILTIDDESLIRQSYRIYLEDCGYLVREAENGRVGLEMIHADQPDLVLVDLRMPEIDGLDVLRDVHTHFPDLPIIVISGTGFVGDAVEAMNSGAWSYLLKPIEDFVNLRFAVEQAFEKARLIKENRSYRLDLEEKVRKRTAALERSNQLLRDTRMQVILRLGKASEVRDKATGRHIIRVSCYTKILAKYLGFSETEADNVALSSALHDVGKIGISDQILLKPGVLTPGEWNQMKEHCQLGKELLNPLNVQDLQAITGDAGGDMEGIVSDSELLQTARIIAYSHHERWDGTGYPDGLRGAEIPMPARIVTIVDIYDAVGSTRPYKEAFPEEVCLKIIQEASGNILDPVVVDAFFANLDKFQRVKEKWGD